MHYPPWQAEDQSKLNAAPWPVTAGMGSGDPLPPLNPKLKKQLKHFLEWMLPSSKVQLDNWSQSFQISVILLSVVLHLIFYIGLEHWKTGEIGKQSYNEISYFYSIST